jgi:hypothetical protein
MNRKEANFTVTTESVKLLLMIKKLNVSLDLSGMSNAKQNQDG